ncbi:Hypothetical protein GL50581_1964 [Giardia duodenalis ATCC 50581]|nr:Hypothetical protein GL50581_1964 [Giardia intestinalis ATCC 50581]
MNIETVERPSSSDITIGCLLELQHHINLYMNERGCHHTLLKKW